MASAFLKAFALVAFLAVLAGAAFAVQSYLGTTGSDNTVGLDAARDTLNATAGHAVTFAVTVRNSGESARSFTVRVNGSGLDATSAPLNVTPGKASTAFVTLPLPPTLSPGTLRLDARAVDATGRLAREKPGLLSLRILAPSVGVAVGDKADVLYTGRLTSSGQVFNTDDPTLATADFARTASYTFTAGALPVETSPPSVVPGFFEALLGMQAGESRTVTFGPDKGYGNATIEDSVPRTDTLAREFPLPITTESVPRDSFDQYINDSKQGVPSNFKAGDIFRFEQGPNKWPYRIVNITSEKVDYTLSPMIGENFTLYPFWTGASAVVGVNETHVVFKTTPTTKLNGTFTMRSYWPDMTRLLSVNETSIVVQHSPPVGFKFTQPATQGQAARHAFVRSVDAQTIVISTVSDNPLAGQSLTFDILLLDVQR